MLLIAGEPGLGKSRCNENRPQGTSPLSESGFRSLRSRAHAGPRSSHSRGTAKSTRRRLFSFTPPQISDHELSGAVALLRHCGRKRFHSNPRAGMHRYRRSRR